jgi:spore coat protein CotH
MQQPINKNKQQTAVEWLIQEIESKGDAWENASIKKIQISIDASEYAELKAQAKEMEKERIKDAFVKC